jgi:hypothetical protein
MNYELQAVTHSTYWVTSYELQSTTTIHELRFNELRFKELRFNELPFTNYDSRITILESFDILHTQIFRYQYDMKQNMVYFQWHFLK